MHTKFRSEVTWHGVRVFTISFRQGQDFVPSVFRRQGLKKIIQDALSESGKWHRRGDCTLQAPVVVSSVIAMSIYRSESIPDLFKGVLTAIRGGRDMSLNDITPEAFYHARPRLGPEPLRLVAQVLGSRVCHGTLHTTFRSRKPRGIHQEAWGLVASYSLLRGFVVDAGRENGILPLEISLVGVLLVVGRTWMRIEDCGEDKRQRGLRRILQDIADCRMDRPRRRRVAPRVVKQKMSNFRLKRNWHRTGIRDFKADLKLVDPPLKS